MAQQIPQPVGVVPEFYSAKQFARLLGISVRTLFRLRGNGEIPAPVEVSTNIIRWRARDVRAYVDGLRPRKVRRRRVAAGPRRERVDT
jgi:predicted DNA-binding transcriptional regulator AlpA